MVAPLAAKRMAHERQELEKASSQEEAPDYFVIFQDDNLFEFDAYIIAPDTIYRYRLVKLHFEIPQDDYPLKPPKVKFIQHTGHRIHPNLYVEGKVCLSILGTWSGEPWAFSMTCHAVLITIRSLLDDEPYKHEPSQNNNPDFNRFVQYSTWKCLLLDYLAKETDPTAKAWLDRYVRRNGQEMLRELLKQQQAANINKQRTLRSPYSPQQTIHVDYPALINDLEAAVSKVHQESNSANSASRQPAALDWERTPKRKASRRQDNEPEIEKEEETDKKRAKPSVAAKCPSTPEIIDLT
ncbi:hypothetical protein INS49_007435 [Diaporthe citri]|uniref:uncharacterized protein n=1 Tax=Diaporthe citri TaxID=83186 RepID=UPI001C80FC82|nr:uncharacterized protein INS49_007435 [Diaporthe citri]KAG6365824.1 hypothetical protein INS49_007435 [Diaporthe citri]